MRVGQRVIFHHISKAAGTSMVNLLRRNYPNGALLEVYDRVGAPAPDPTPRAYASFLTKLDPESWDGVRCLAGHSVNFAIPVLSGPFQVFTIVRDPVDRVVSLYHYLKGREGFGERGDVAGDLIREHDWSLADIYRTFGGARPTEEGEHQLFAAFFNGQARAVLAPHFPANYIPMTDGQPDAPAALETLEWVLSEHYILGSAARYAASLERFAIEFGWSDKTVMRENVTAGRPPLDEVPGDVVEMIRAYNAIDEELHLRALAELVDVPDPEPEAQPASARGARRRRTADRTGEVNALMLKLRAREHELTHAQQALQRVERTNERLAAALSRLEQQRRDLEMRLERHERELGDKVRIHERGLARLRAELAHLGGLLTEERSQHNHLRGVSAARDLRLQEVTGQLAEYKRAVESDRQASREMASRLADTEAEVARLRADNSRLAGALEEEQAEHRRERQAGEALDRRREVAAMDLAEHVARRERKLAETQRALAELRAGRHALEGDSAAKDARVTALEEELSRGERELAQARQAQHELESRAQRREEELADLRGLVSGVLSAGREVAGELGFATSAGDETLPEPGIALLEETLQRARETLIVASEDRRTLGENLDAREEEVVRATSQVRRLESALAQARAEADDHESALAALIVERRALAGQARSLVSSRAWRYGHRVAKVIRWITFRPSKTPAGAAERLLGMLEAPPQLPPLAAGSDNGHQPSDD